MTDTEMAGMTNVTEERQISIAKHTDKWHTFERVAMWTLLLYSVIVSTYILQWSANCNCSDSNVLNSNQFGFNSNHPTTGPTVNPIQSPSMSPTNAPITLSPTTMPSNQPSTRYPTSTNPTRNPTTAPSLDPTSNPSFFPTSSPTFDPTFDPTSDPTIYPSHDPTIDPTVDPITDPTHMPSIIPTMNPSTVPSSNPTTDPTTEPTENPTVEPTLEPTTNPTIEPTTAMPTNVPTLLPTVILGNIAFAQLVNYGGFSLSGAKWLTVPFDGIPYNKSISYDTITYQTKFDIPGIYKCSIAFRSGDLSSNYWGGIRISGVSVGTVGVSNSYIEGQGSGERDQQSFAFLFEINDIDDSYVIQKGIDASSFVLGTLSLDGEPLPPVLAIIEFVGSI